MLMQLERIGHEGVVFGIDPSNNKQKFVIGRQASCDIKFSSTHVSRKHCEICIIPPRGTLILKNVSQTNKTYVDEVILDTEGAIAELRVGSIIGVGVPFTHMLDASKPNYVYLKLIEGRLKEEEIEIIEERSFINTNGRIFNNELSPVPSTSFAKPLEICNLFQNNKSRENSIVSKSCDTSHTNSLNQNNEVSSHSTLNYANETTVAEVNDQNIPSVSSVAEENDRNTPSVSSVAEENEQNPPSVAEENKQNIPSVAEENEQNIPSVSKSRCVNDEGISIDPCTASTHISELKVPKEKNSPLLSNQSSKLGLLTPRNAKQELDSNTPNLSPINNSLLQIKKSPFTPHLNKVSGNESSPVLFPNSLMHSTPCVDSVHSLPIPINESSSVTPNICKLPPTTKYENLPQPITPEICKKPSMFAKGKRKQTRDYSDQDLFEEETAKKKQKIGSLLQDLANQPRPLSISLESPNPIPDSQELLTTNWNKPKKNVIVSSSDSDSEKVKPQNKRSKRLKKGSSKVAELKTKVKDCVVVIEKVNDSSDASKNKSNKSDTSFVRLDSKSEFTLETSIKENSANTSKAAVTNRFNLMSSDTDDDLLPDLTDSISNQMSPIKDVKVKPTSSNNKQNNICEDFEHSSAQVNGFNTETNNNQKSDLNYSECTFEIKKEMLNEEQEKNNEIAVKKENAESSDNEDDESNILMYSQMDDVILLSSDDECSMSMQMNENDLIKSEADDSDIPFIDVSDNKPMIDKDVIDLEAQEELDDDEQEEPWFPILSQSFFDEDIIDGETPDTAISESLPSTSTKIIEPISEDNQMPPMPEPIKSNVKKPLKTAVLIDPIKIPSRTKSDTIRKRKSPRKAVVSPVKESRPSKSKTDSSISESSKSKSDTSKSKSESKKTESETSKSKESSVRARTRSTSQESSRTSRSKKGNTSLRKNLTKSYNLDAYNSESKKKHHMYSSKEIPSTSKAPEVLPSIVSSKENISVQKSHTPKESRSTVVAKQTRKSRSQKLTEVQLFPSPDVASSRKLKKIPKKSKENVLDEILGRENKKQMPSSPLEKPKESEKDHRKLPVANKVTETLNITGSFSPVRGDENTDPTIQTVKQNATPKTKKRIHFPSRIEDLEKIRFISPLAKSHQRSRNNEAPLIISSIKFTHRLTSWNYDWLKTYHQANESKKMKGGGGNVQPPPVAETGMKNPTLILYESFKDYVDVFSTMLYYDMWEQVYKDWLKYYRDRFWFTCILDGKEPRPLFEEQRSSCISLHRFKIITLVSRHNNAQQPKKGSLIAIRNYEGEKKQYMFGYVEGIFRDNRKYRAPKELIEMVKDGETFLQINVLASKDAFRLYKNQRITSVAAISFVRNNVSCFEALCHLPKSRLFDAILTPTPNFFQTECRYRDYLVDEMPMNKSQTEAILQVSEKCLIDNDAPKISLIHGPPGTGKTRTIVSLITQMLRLSKQLGCECRILLCAPSNAAVDETTLRLLKLREININLKIVRVGVKDSVHPDVVPYCLDTLIANNMAMDTDGTMNESTVREISRKKKLIDDLVANLEIARKKGEPNQKLHSMEARLAELVRSKQELEKSCQNNLSYHEKMKKHDEWQSRLLLNAEVITSTLGFCTSNIMTQVFSKVQRPFTCCIIDEAGQCKETETWLPLMMGINKYVLVGDHKQLPACVLAQDAKDKKYYQSLFERYFHYFVVEQDMPNIIHQLNVQYRMHPEIAAWPSYHFYDGLLLSDKSYNIDRTYGFKPYAVFNIKDSREQEGNCGEICNESEARLVLRMIEALEQRVIGLSIGVITPYTYQKHKLNTYLKPYIKKMNITVNTIDAFQGQEKDIVILSFVRANSNANIGFLSQRQRLNVALTRAKKSCFIIGHLSTLSTSQDWKSLIRDAKARKVVMDLSISEIDKVDKILEKLQK